MQAMQAMQAMQEVQEVQERPKFETGTVFTAAQA